MPKLGVIASTEDENPLWSTAQAVPFLFDGGPAPRQSTTSIDSQHSTTTAQPLPRARAFRLPHTRRAPHTVAERDRAEAAAKSSPITPTVRPTSAAHREDMATRMQLAVPTSSRTTSSPRMASLPPPLSPQKLAQPATTHEEPKPLDSMLFFLEGLGEGETATSLLSASQLYTPEMRSTSFSTEKASQGTTAVSPVVHVSRATTATRTAAMPVPPTTPPSTVRQTCPIVVAATPTPDLDRDRLGPVTRAPPRLTIPATDPTTPDTSQPFVRPPAPPLAVSTMTVDVPMSFLLSPASAKGSAASFTTEEDVGHDLETSGFTTRPRAAAWADTTQLPIPPAPCATPVTPQNKPRTALRRPVPPAPATAALCHKGGVRALCPLPPITCQTAPTLQTADSRPSQLCTARSGVGACSLYDTVDDSDKHDGDNSDTGLGRAAPASMPPCTMKVLRGSRSAASANTADSGKSTPGTRMTDTTLECGRAFPSAPFLVTLQFDFCESRRI